MQKKICYISKKEKFYAALEEEVITIKKNFYSLNQDGVESYYLNEKVTTFRDGKFVVL